MQLEEVQKQKQEQDKIKDGVRNRERAREFHQVFFFGNQGVYINASFHKLDFTYLTLSSRKSLSYRNQSIDSMVSM